MSSAIAQLEMQTRIAPSRPVRLGTRRRRAPKGAEPGASRLSGAKAPSLDTDKQLATTVREWDHQQKTEGELRAEQWALHKQLNGTVHEIWQDHAAAGNTEEAMKWEKQWLRLHNCQSEWIAYRAACCQSMTTPVAVPIGCNHRLCPLCAWHRSQGARKRIKSMFDRLTHPVLITLTVPNKDTIRKHDYTLFRQRVRKFIADHKEWIHGGVYSLETTYNRREKTWHIHTHILADVCSALPAKTEKIELAGQRIYAFTAIKLKLEFDWMRLWNGRWSKKSRKKASKKNALEGDTYYGEKLRKGASKLRSEEDATDFENWVRLGREMRLKEWRDGAYRTVQGVSEKVLEMRSKWNSENRRVIDLRPVTDRDGAAREVLKYITKVADFCDIKEAVEPFCNAIKGARLIQTFGSWYNVKLDVPADPENPKDDWGEMKCSCGCNEWKRMGVFYRDDVAMNKDGRWHLKWPLDYRSRGTVPRPTIRALDVYVESE